MRKKIGIFFFCNFPVAGKNNNNNNEKKCNINLDGLLPKSYCERRNCIVMQEIILQPWSVVGLGEGHDTVSVS